MIYLTDEQRNKLILLDKLFGTLDTERITKIIEEEEIISRLKGVTTHSNVLMTLLNDHEDMSKRLSELQMDFINLKNDLQFLIRAVDKPYDSLNQSTFLNLKGKYGIY